MGTESNDELQLKIRELEKEVARLHSQIKEQRYGLTWLDVPEAFDKESENKIPILEEVKDKAISDDSGKPSHILIEGDNYHALTCLNYTHRGKIDVIYIDPPYNTGNDGFTYKDKRFLTEFPDGTVVPREHPLRHSYWLSFMSKRLELAKNLLSDKGVIFISIDDNEQANLKLLCDKVFGEDNFIGVLKWKRKKQPSFLATHIASIMEYIIVYAKNKSKLEKLSIEGTSDATKKVVNLTNQYSNRHFSVGVEVKIGSQGIIKKGSYQIKTTVLEFLNDVRYENWKTIDEVDVKAQFSVSQQKIDSFIEQGLLFITKNNGLRRNVSKEEIGKRKSITDLLLNNKLKEETDGEWGDNQESDNEIRSLLGANIFDYAKPTNLIKNLVKSFNSNSSTILDFFAGSGTTLHATLKLNTEDGGSRQCILVQQAEGENNICQNVTYERNRRVMCGYTNAKGEQIAGIGGTLKYYKTDFVGKHQPREASDEDKVLLSQKAGCLLALGENTLEEVETTTHYQIYSDKNDRYTGIYFSGDTERMAEFTQKLETLRNDNRYAKFAVYFFCWGSPDVFENEFDSMRQIIIKSIPQPILDIYKSINQ